MRKVAETVLADTGEVKVTVDALIKKMKITRTKLAGLIDVDYRVVKRLCSGETQRVELSLLSRICYALECNLSDIIEYTPPKK